MSSFRVSIVIAALAQAWAGAQHLGWMDGTWARSIDAIRGGDYGEQCNSCITGAYCLKSSCSQVPCSALNTEVWGGGGPPCPNDGGPYAGKIPPPGSYTAYACGSGGVQYTSDMQEYPADCKQTSLGSNAIGCGSGTLDCGTKIACNACEDPQPGAMQLDPCHPPQNSCCSPRTNGRWYCQVASGDPLDFKVKTQPPDDDECGEAPPE
jgi:hypothetical protein